VVFLYINAVVCRRIDRVKSIEVHWWVCGVVLVKQEPPCDDSGGHIIQSILRDTAIVNESSQITPKERGAGSKSDIARHRHLNSTCQLRTHKVIQLFLTYIKTVDSRECGKCCRPIRHNIYNIG